MTRYHWVITIWRLGQGTMRTRWGTVTPTPGETRGQLYDRLREDLREPEPYAVMFFSLEPDELPLAAGKDENR